MRSGADLLCDALLARGVTCVTGLPGGQTLALHEALRVSGIRCVLTTHELAATFLANGHHRASGRIAPVVTIGGPGFAYALAGLAEARDDSAAVLHVLAGEPAAGHGFGFQTLDAGAVAAAVVKGIISVRTPDEVPAAVGAALDLAAAGEPGPVLLEWASAALEGSPSAMPRAVPPSPPARAPEDRQLEEVAARLASARRPVLLAGQGCADAAEALRGLAERLGAPVLTTVSGRGTVPEDHPLAMGFDAERGSLAEANALLEAADLVLAVGCKLGSGLTGGSRMVLPADRLVHVDASAHVLGARYPALQLVEADAGAFLAGLAQCLPSGSAAWSAPELRAWRSRLRALRSMPEPSIAGVPGGTPAALFAALRAVLPRDGVVVTDSGLHQTLVRRHLDVLAPRGLLPPTDFQSMGFALPAALGAKLACPARAVVAVLGDGGFAMSGLELLTAVREDLPITAVVLNDGYLNRIRLEQLKRYGRAADVDLVNPEYEAFARSLGIGYDRCEGDPEATFRAALSADRPVLVEVRVGDSWSSRGARARGMARAMARRTLGIRVAERLRAVLMGDAS